MKKLASLSAIVALSAAVVPFGQAQATSTNNHSHNDKDNSSFAKGDDRHQSAWSKDSDWDFHKANDYDDDDGHFPRSAINDGKGPEKDEDHDQAKDHDDKDPEHWAVGLSFTHDWKKHHHKKHRHKHKHKHPSEVPLPGALPLMGSVLGGGFLLRRWRRARNGRTRDRLPD